MSQPRDVGISKPDTAQASTNNFDNSGPINNSNINVGSNITQIISADQRSCPTPRPQPDHFGGRDHELNQLITRLEVGQTTAIVAVQGLGGIGKTTLALQVAAQLYQQKIFRAVLWADVTSTPQPLILLQSWAAYADPNFQIGDRPLSAVANQIKGLLETTINDKCQQCEPARILVVLDDVWDSGLEIARLLRLACPAQSTILITSRSEKIAINLGAKVEQLGRLHPVEAAALLRQYLPNTDQTLLEKLGEVLGGHPLALTLAAKRVLMAKNPAKALPLHLAKYIEKLPAGVEFKQLKLDQG